jgi:hypothetical protein
MKKISLFNDATASQVSALKYSVIVTNQSLINSDYKIDVNDCIVDVYKINSTSREVPLFSVTFGEAPNGDLFYASECGHDDDPWCEHLELFFRYRMDRPLVAMLAGRKVQVIMPVYPRDNFGLVVRTEPDPDFNDLRLWLDLWGEKGRRTYQVGEIESNGSLKSIKNMLEDLIYHIVDINEEISGKQCSECFNSVEAPEMSAQEMWHIAVNGVCNKCASKAKSLDDVVPDVTGFATGGIIETSGNNKIATGTSDLKKFASTGKFEGNTHGK